MAIELGANISGPSSSERVPIFRVEDLQVVYRTKHGDVPAVDHVSFTLQPGQRLGLIGESGSGKTTMGTALMRMTRPPGFILGGRVMLGNDDLLKLDDFALRRIRLRHIALVPQGAMNSLNPVMPLQDQMMDAILAHEPGYSRTGLAALVAAQLEKVGLPQTAARRFPHELSGGMKQRAVMAISTVLNPAVIVADEPTSALDVVVQRQVMLALGRLQGDIGSAVILIGHDMGLIAQFADLIGVMYAGRLVEIGLVDDILSSPLHPYTRMLIDSLPKLAAKGKLVGIPGAPPALLNLPKGCAFHPRCPFAFDRCRVETPISAKAGPERETACHLYPGNTQLPQRPDLISLNLNGPVQVVSAQVKSELVSGWPEIVAQDTTKSKNHIQFGGGTLTEATPLLELRNVTKIFHTGIRRTMAGTTVALSNVSLTVPGEFATSTAVAGESGSGKTTMARILLGLTKPSSGQVIYKGINVAEMNRTQISQYRREVQPIFQDPYEVYNPFYKIDHVLVTALRNFGLTTDSKGEQRLMHEALEIVGLRPRETLGRYPHELSGGQRQRIMVARALMLRPKIIMADEPVSMVDASLRATILDELRKINIQFGISLVYITHDLTTAYQVCDNIVILYQGTVAEAGSVERVILDPRHPYTKLLVSSIPLADRAKRWGADAVEVLDSAGRANTGCRFAPRCPSVMEMCWGNVPPLFRLDEDRVGSCFQYDKSPLIRPDQIREIFYSHQSKLLQ